jgi:hypothetical protein
MAAEFLRRVSRCGIQAPAPIAPAGPALIVLLDGFRRANELRL